MQQLYEAGEEEFLEIMALVGMASKPLHVRRLQKALQEWASSPNSCTFILFGPASSSNSALVQLQSQSCIRRLKELIKDQLMLEAVFGFQFMPSFCFSCQN